MKVWVVTPWRRHAGVPTSERNLTSWVKIMCCFHYLMIEFIRQSDRVDQLFQRRSAPGSEMDCAFLLPNEDKLSKPSRSSRLDTVQHHPVNAAGVPASHEVTECTGVHGSHVLLRFHSLHTSRVMAEESGRTGAAGQMPENEYPGWPTDRLWTETSPSLSSVCHFIPGNMVSVRWKWRGERERKKHSLAFRLFNIDNWKRSIRRWDLSSVTVTKHRLARMDGNGKLPTGKTWKHHLTAWLFFHLNLKNRLKSTDHL